MIFSYTLNQVVSGIKSQTRRPVKTGEYLDAKCAIRKSNGRVLYQTGKSYAVQPARGKRAVGRIIITGIRQEELVSISEADVYCEGFSSKADFLATWRAIHGSSLGYVWVIEFEFER